MTVTPSSSSGDERAIAHLFILLVLIPIIMIIDAAWLLRQIL